MRRPVRTAAAVAVAALALAACGRSADTGSQAQASEPINEGPATGTIDVWAMGTEGEELGQFVKAFEKANPEATVNVTAVPWESAHDKIATAIAAGKTPDVSLIGSTWMGEFAEADGLEPTPDGLVDEKAFFPGAWDSTVVGGTSYGVPWYVETRVLFYRTDIAQKAGWNEAPKTWDELTQFAKDLQAKGGSQYGLYVQPGQTGAWQHFMPFAWQNGAEMTNAAETEYTIDSAATVEALEYYKSLFTAGLSQTRLLDPGELEQGFADGTYGSFINGPWYTGLVEDAGLKPNLYSVAPVPGKDSAPGTSFIGGGNLAVFAEADNRKGAWKLVQWLTEPQTQSDWYQTMGGLPAVQESWSSGELASDPKLSVFGDQLEHAASPPAVPTWEQVAAVLDSDIEKAVKGAVPTKEAVADMQSQAGTIGTGLTAR
ncbi:MAG TPA: sugar ABC transporter substrate-binding protein [Nocardioidaceae bacterium]|nr:sugar ABC transporter substrate-binding protein [Nocardioidaceae bacterium]